MQIFHFWVAHFNFSIEHYFPLLLLEFERWNGCMAFWLLSTLLQQIFNENIYYFL